MSRFKVMTNSTNFTYQTIELRKKYLKLALIGSKPFYLRMSGKVVEFLRVKELEEEYIKELYSLFEKQFIIGDNFKKQEALDCADILSRQEGVLKYRVGFLEYYAPLLAAIYVIMGATIKDPLIPFTVVGALVSIPIMVEKFQNKEMSMIQTELSKDLMNWIKNKY